MKKITPVINIAGNRAAALLLLAGSLFFATETSAQTKRFVKPAPAGTADGSSWDNASNDIQLMINNSVKGDTIWVAGGTYKPNRKASDVTVITPNDRDNAFVLKDSVQVYGGFAGTEITLSQRDLGITANASILSADFNGDDAFEFSGDTLNIANNAENAYHVIVTVAWDEDPINSATRLDGFTITGGNANDPAFSFSIVYEYDIYRYAGGGIINRNSSAPTYANLIITGNYAVYGGGAYNRYLSDATYNNVVFNQNVAQLGGGVYNWETVEPGFSGVTISNNRADAGAGVYNLTGSNPSFTDCTISGNFATVGGGGGVFSNNSLPVFNEVSITGNSAATNGGGLYNTTNASVIITNSDIADNTAATGGGIFADGNSNVSLTDVNILENQAVDGNGGGFYNYQSVPVLNGVNFSNNSATGVGGGMANWTGGDALVTGSVFSENTAPGGGGVFNFNGANPVFTNVEFLSNTATDGNGGGVQNRQNVSPVFTNCLFAGNTANYGGGIYNFDNAVPVLTNTTISANEATIHGGGLASDGSSPIVRNSIIYGNTASEEVSHEVFNFNNAIPVYTYSLIGGTAETWEYTGTDGGNNVQGDPLFADAAAGNFALTAQSPARNTGNNTYFDAGQTPDLTTIITDLAGNPRIYNNSIVDMGAYELQQTVGLQDFSALQVLAYPNPVGSVLTLSAGQEITSVAVYNMLGQQVSATWNSTNNTLNMAALQAGNYVVKATIGKATGSVLVVKK
ncbi:hypothetical protein AM493_14140 [Flavobacterium akiainvivens]|uniref:Secretion system C-terminal sorting domain-containing protein n=1 Tax=Flavobacterium akiainvivens TaxID=1202724 RepID=A0A0M8ME95_9FLAO|nr:T9SS type A sorting domain-containing protein [Flavobacterium akiainvivens]KOS07044.1 hypothetical protein AM493_14140 [Flavobacterium akiainvivens]SFQ58798.1 Por secretion system C-terminal sorting domain-containing protein [Flavobacterium akiainvivens]